MNLVHCRRQIFLREASIYLTWHERLGIYCLVRFMSPYTTQLLSDLLGNAFPSKYSSLTYSISPSHWYHVDVGL
jgi:hypothetical protein